MRNLAICPGTFDPFTNGHLDIVRRSLGVFDRVIVAVASNPKKAPLFTTEERIRFIRESVSQIADVEVEAFDGLLVDYVRSKGSAAVVRGLRAVSDFEYELMMALMNRKLDAVLETVFMMPSEEFIYLTSTVVKEVASFGGDTSKFVPPCVEKALAAKYAASRRAPSGS